MKHIKQLLCSLFFVTLIPSGLVAMESPSTPPQNPNRVNRPPQISKKRRRNEKIEKEPSFSNPFKNLEPPQKKRKKNNEDINIYTLIQKRSQNPKCKNNLQIQKTLRKIYKKRINSNKFSILSKSISQVIATLLKTIKSELKPNKNGNDRYTVDLINQKQQLKEKIKIFQEKFNNTYITRLAYFCITEKTLDLGQSKNYESPQQILQTFAKCTNVTPEKINEWTIFLIKKIIQEITQLQDIDLLKINNNHLNTKNIIDIISRCNIAEFRLDNSKFTSDKNIYNKRDLANYFQEKLTFFSDISYNLNEQGNFEREEMKTALLKNRTITNDFPTIY
jgi:hypothetical protein